MKKWVVVKKYDYKNEPICLQELNEDGKIQLFEKSPFRVHMWNQYLASWKEWAEEEKKKEPVRVLYDLLWRWHGILQQDDGTYELLVGNGVTRSKDNAELNYPLIVKPIAITFESAKSECCLVDLGKHTELVTDVLNGLAGQVGMNLTGKDQLRDLDPWDGLAAEDAFRALLNQITTDGKIYKEKRSGGPASESVSISLEPVFFLRRRTRALGKLVDQAKQAVNNETIPINPFLRNLIEETRSQSTDGNELSRSIEERLARSCGESSEILLAKPANLRQLQIAEDIEKNDVVVVQGPPGTGKTHTIANLLGNFLAEGKTVLVTSEKKKALQVLKGQMLTSLQGACISLCEDNAGKDAAQTVSSILYETQNRNKEELVQNIARGEEDRGKCIAELANTRKLIFSLRNKQDHWIRFLGKDISIPDAATFVKEHQTDYGYIPGSVLLSMNECMKAIPFPLSAKECEELYATNKQISAMEEHQLELSSLPKPAELINPQWVESWHEQWNNTEARRIKLLETAASVGILSIAEDGERADTYVVEEKDKHYAISFSEASKEYLKGMADLLRESHFPKYILPWMEQAVTAGIQEGGNKENWLNLVQQIREADSFYEAHCTFMEVMEVSIPVMTSNSMDLMHSILDHVDEQGQCNRIWKFCHREEKKFYDGILINGQGISSKEQLQNVYCWMEYKEKLSALRPVWNHLVGEDPSVPTMEELEKKYKRPTENMLKTAALIQQCLSHKEVYEKTEKMVCTLGWVGCFLENTYANKAEEVAYNLHLFNDRLPILLEWALYVLYEKELMESKAKWEGALLSYPEQMQDKADLLRALREVNVGLYRTAYNRFSDLWAKQHALIRRNELLDKLASMAPGWAEAIRTRYGGFGADKPQENWIDAWKWKAFAFYLDQLNKTSLDEEQKKVERKSQELRELTAELCENKAWLHIKERLENDGQLSGALQGWANAIKNIGKGKGKNVAIYRSQAQKNMDTAQRAIPVWIMPFYEVYTMFDPEKAHFDVIIVDEASQSDISALSAMTLADKVVVVGDDKQVSPSIVGVQNKDVENLQKSCSIETLPAPVQGVLNTINSLYDAAKLAGNVVMLEEHFRCVPDIIEYSNWLSYENANGKGGIKPLRPESSTQLHPNVVLYHTDGIRDGNGPNDKEARMVANLVAACCENPAYAGKSMGVISLLSSSNQDALISKYLSELLTTSEMNRRNIICGTPASFQGDERDVMFLSMVDSAAPGEIKNFMGAKLSKYNQRYNVAMSRARDQVWVVCSLNKDNLQSKPGEPDIRRSLLEYAENPRAFYDTANIRKKADSPFEVAVCNALKQQGYDYHQQWKAGVYKIDILVTDGTHQMAIECDGEQFHSGEAKIREDMIRQTILERMGYQFIRIRGSEFYLDPDKTMQRVYKELAEHEVHPSANTQTVDEGQNSKIVDAIKIRAEQIFAGDSVQIAAPQAKSTKQPSTVKKVSTAKRQVKSKTRKSGSTKSTSSKTAAAKKKTSPRTSTRKKKETKSMGLFSNAD